MLLSFIIVSWNTRGLVRRAVESIVRYASDLSYETLVVDNASADSTVEMLENEFPQIILIANRSNVGFGTANNQAMRRARGRFLFLLNSDAELLDSVAPCIEFMRASGAGLLGCRLKLPDGRTQVSCRRFPSLPLPLLEGLSLHRLLPRGWRARVLLSGHWAHDRAQYVDWVAAAAVMVRRDVFDQTGGFDERIFMYGEDLEWCMRIRDAGWPIAFFPRVEVRHRAHASGRASYGEGLFDVSHSWTLL